MHEFALGAKAWEGGREEPRRKEPGREEPVREEPVKKEPGREERGSSWPLIRKPGPAECAERLNNMTSVLPEVLSCC